MNLGCMLVLTEFRHLAEMLLPVGHKVIGERPALHSLCTELLTEGPDMPVWEEGEAMAIVDMVTVSEVQQCEVTQFMLTWYHKQLDVWTRVIPTSERTLWVIGMGKIRHELDILYRGRLLGNSP